LLRILENRTGEAPIERDISWLAPVPERDPGDLKRTLRLALEAEVSAKRVPMRVARQLALDADAGT
jgi:hypothetical protein